MDEIVRQAMQKWPNVPHCYGWLGLDARGDWYMRDDRVQSLGRFASGSPGAKGARLAHDKLIAFIGRNYAADARVLSTFKTDRSASMSSLRLHLGSIAYIRKGPYIHILASLSIARVLTDERGWPTS